MVHVPVNFYSNPRENDYKLYNMRIKPIVKHHKIKIYCEKVAYKEESHGKAVCLFTFGTNDDVMLTSHVGLFHDNSKKLRLVDGTLITQDRYSVKTKRSHIFLFLVTSVIIEVHIFENKIKKNKHKNKK